MNKNIQTEVDAGYLYKKLAENETDETIANVFRQMSEIEKSHAEAFLQKQKNKKKLPVTGAETNHVTIYVPCWKVNLKLLVAMWLNLKAGIVLLAAMHY